jgi:hypothetical protein
MDSLLGLHAFPVFIQRFFSRSTQRKDVNADVKNIGFAT